MKAFLLLILCCMALVVSALSDTKLTRDLAALHLLSAALEKFQSETSGVLPSDLTPLRNFLDLPDLLRPETDPQGAFPDRYAFVPAVPWIDIPGSGQAQIILISVKPSANGSRGGIWRYYDGRMYGGFISKETLDIGLKDFDFASLKPMGGPVPPPTHPFPEPPITEYEAKVWKLIQEGKITPPPRNGIKFWKAGPAATHPASPVPHPTTPSTLTERTANATTQPESDPHNKPLWIWPLAILATAGLAFVVWKRRV